MLIQQSKPAEKDTQLYINGNNMSYFISEHGEGRTAETLRQAIYRGNVIVAPWEKPYEQYGFNRFCDNVAKQDYKITYLTLHQMEKISEEGLEEKYSENHPLEVCVDEGRILLQELLREKIGVPVKVNFMALDTGDIDT